MTRVWIWKNRNIRSHGNFPHPKFRKKNYAQKHKILQAHYQVRIYTSDHLSWLVERCDTLKVSNSWASRWPSGKEYACQLRSHRDRISGLGRSPGRGNGNPRQYSCLENSMDRADWQLQSMGLQRVGHDWAHTYTHTSAPVS